MPVLVRITTMENMEARDCGRCRVKGQGSIKSDVVE